VLVAVAAAIVVLGAATGAELGATAGDEDVAGAAVGAFGEVGVAAATAVVGESIAGELGSAPPEGAAVACPNIFDMRLVNIPIGVKYAPLRAKSQPA
jgi:hypothetical protein